MSILVDCKLISVDENLLDELKAKKSDVFNDSDVMELLNENVEILASPRISIRDGQQGSLEIEELLAQVDGKENYNLAVNLSVDGKIQDDNKTVILKIDSQFRAKEPDDETKKGYVHSNTVTTQVLVPNNGTVIFGGDLNIMPGKRISLLVKPSITKDKPVVEQKDQVLIKTRFVVLDSVFLKDIGLAADNVDADSIKEPYSMPKVSYEFFESDKSMNNKKTAALLRRMGISEPNDIVVGYLNDENLFFFLRTAQAHANSRTLTSSKLTVFNGEPVSITIKNNNYIGGYEEIVGDDGKSLEKVIYSLESGINLNLVPRRAKKTGSIDLDFDYDYLNIISWQQRKHKSGEEYDVVNFLKSQAEARLEIPKGKTLMIAGLKLLLTATETTSTNNSQELKASDLIVLIKPTVIEAKKPIDESILVK